MFLYNNDTLFSSVMCNPNGKGYIVTATNIALGETIEVSNVISSIEEATFRAMKFAGHSTHNPTNSDEVEQYLSERLGF